MLMAGAGLLATSLAAPALAQSEYAVIKAGVVSGGSNVKVHGINALTSCPRVLGTALAPLDDVVTGAGLTMDDWNEFLDVLQYIEDEDEKENYKCWMLQYLSECVFCPPCPDEDPYK